MDAPREREQLHNAPAASGSHNRVAVMAAVTAPVVNSDSIRATERPGVVVRRG